MANCFCVNLAESTNVVAATVVIIIQEIIIISTRSSGDCVIESKKMSVPMLNIYKKAMNIYFGTIVYRENVEKDRFWDWRVFHLV